MYDSDRLVGALVMVVVGFERQRGNRETGVRFTLDVMSAEREELRRLVEELPALTCVRRHLRRVASRPWPPAWFGAGKSSRRDTAARSEDLLADGFGRRV